ncbi:TetR/AcrR family transcriptional regulator [Microbacterium sp. CFH 90308]|uniref:TetR/AcrR family transcriptional regulator n=1 Tax=Microbacterium salsuginis TaxID=2722803 RepID=A0ABX1KFC6_9MICO|nr:TetR/AcrR family transcriptional regulator [Microbacterium sp. CFH 90308]NLP85757.1 TetR/AcrR family transcriptional regulator [Microbacterium sp. CFH 90308]
MPRPLIDNRRERILDAAEALVLDRGFDAMSVARVAEGAEIGKGAVYLEFASKHDILDGVLTRATARLQARVDAELGIRPSLSAAYRAAARALLADELMSAAFLDDRGILGSHVDAVADGRYRARHRSVVAWLCELERRDALADGVNPEHLAIALSSATIGLLSAARIIGPLTPAQLEGAIETFAHMVAVYER